MKYSVNFYFDRDKDKVCDARSSKELCKLRMRIRWKSGCASFSVGYRICVEGWNPKTQRCKKGSWHGSDGDVAFWAINGRIGVMEQVAHEVMSELGEGADVMTVKYRVNSLLGRECRLEVPVGGKKCHCPTNVGECIRYFIEHRNVANSWSEGTRKKYEELHGYVASHCPDDKMHDVDSEWLEELENWFVSIGLRNVTIRVMLDMMRWFLKWAEEEGGISGRDWRRFSPKLKTVPRKVVFLTWDELMRVWNLDLDDAPMRWARDLFCLECFTSLRYSDVVSLMHSQVKGEVIELVTKKTHEAISIELNRYAKEVLDKYVNLAGEHAMPQMSIQRVNKLLKEIGKLAQLDELVEMVWYAGSRRVSKVYRKWEILSTHCGRRTFICNSLAMGIPAETVMKWTGHSNYNAMKPYIDVADETKRREMQKWDRWGE